MAESKGIRLKKRYGQHFLKSEHVLESMFDAVCLDTSSSVLEIGCGEGLLTAAILRHPIARLWVYEIDAEWAEHVRNTLPDKRLTVHTTNFLDVDLTVLSENAPWTVLANLPYQVTFPILYRFQHYRAFLKEGVVMVQEEVAQKIVKSSGRGYGFVSLFFQYYFEWKLLEKIPPSAFYPPPKVFSRLIYFKPRSELQVIPHENEFWEFIQRCFSQPRRTILNNLKGSIYALDRVPDDTKKLRAQQMKMEDFLALWIRLHQI